MFLITTALEKSWRTDEDIVFLGEWCKIYSRKNLWENISSSVAPYHWDDRSTFYNDHIYLTETYEYYLSHFVSILNDVHNIDQSKRYWRIVIGPWLRYFIDSIYDRYRSIKTVESMNCISSTWIIQSDPYKWTPTDFINFYNWFTTDKWNHYIYSEIIKYINPFPFQIIDGNNNPKRLENKSVFSKSREYLNKFLFAIYRQLIPDRFNTIVFISSFFPKSFLIRLQLRMRQIPYVIWPRLKVSSRPCDELLRQRVTVNKARDEFEQVLEHIFAAQFPKSYLECFNSIRNSIESYYPSKIKSIFTANAYSHDDTLKIWMAESAERGTKLLVSQHGGNFGSCLWAQDEEHQLTICDIFYTWGWKTEHLNHLLPMTAPKLLSTSDNIKPSASGAILVVLASAPRYFYCSYSFPVAGQYLSYLEDQFTFLNNLSPDTIIDVKVRLDPLSSFGWHVKSRFGDRGYNNLLETPDRPLLERLRGCKLCVSTNNATVLLETLAANFPTIVFWDARYYELRREAIPYYSVLVEAGILHYSAETAARVLNDIGSDPISWWATTEVQRARNIFCNQYARTGDKWLHDWSSELSNY